jgi:hypothetical protein
MLRRFGCVFMMLAMVCASASADTVAYLSAGAAPPGNLDLSLPNSAIGTNGSFDIFIQSNELVAGASLNLIATGDSINLTGAAVPQYSPRWASAQNGTVAVGNKSIVGMDAFAIPGFGSNGLNPATAGSDAGYNAGANAFHYGTVNYSVIGAGETTFKFVIGDIEFGVEGPIFLGTGDAAAAPTGAGSAGATSALIDGRIVVQGGVVNIAPSVADLPLFTTTTLGEVVNLQPIDSAPGTPPIAWSAVLGNYAPGHGAPGDAPGLGSASFAINPTSGAFQFNTLGATRGVYTFNGTATGPGGTDTFSLSVDVTQVPEPATLGLIGLSLVGLVGYRRKK